MRSKKRYIALIIMMILICIGFLTGCEKSSDTQDESMSGGAVASDTVDRDFWEYTCIETKTDIQEEPDLSCYRIVDPGSGGFTVGDKTLLFKR
ncbi:MAG: hypothetical protein ACI4EG_14070 [Fusicatenibacter sp.]|nr:hypothetical protein [Fusicatenibacter sp.]